MNGNALSLSAACALLLVGCGGGSSTPASEGDMVLTGVFVDSAVAGASYATETQSGTTNAAGEFNYMTGETVTFSIGDTQLPTINAAAQVSPVDMGATSSNPTNTTTNIARLLQSLDTDGNVSNGITISADAAAISSAINFDVSVDQFANDTAVINMVANSGSVNSGLIAEIQAISHLEDTLNTEISAVNNDVQTSTFFTADLLVGRTLVPYPIDVAMNPHSTIRFDSSSVAQVVGVPNGTLSDSEFPITIDGSGVVTIDFESFEAGTLATMELASENEGVLTVDRTWQGNPDPTLTFTLSTPVSTSDFGGRTISVVSNEGVGTIDFLTNGQFTLDNLSSDAQSGPYTQHSVDGVILGNFPTSYSVFVLASGTLDDGFIMSTQYEDNQATVVEFYETSGNTWTVLHSAAR